MNIATPSWVIPGTYAENIKFLEESMENIGTIELLFFIYDDRTRALLDADWIAIREGTRRFRYTAHLPGELKPEHEVLVEKLGDLVSHFIVHPGPIEAAEDLASILNIWIDRFGDRFLMENTRMEEFRALVDLVPRAGICLDTGHLLLEGGSPASFLSQHGKRVREIHLHGITEPTDGRLPDHRALDGDESWLLDLEFQLRSFPGVVNLEVFSWAEVERSLLALRKRGLIPERMKE